MSAPAKNVLAVGKTLMRTVWSSEQFILALPRAAYTTARTFGRTAVFELEAHAERLARSAIIMSSPVGISEAELTRSVRSLFITAAATAILNSSPASDFTASGSPPSDPTHNVGEHKLTFLLLLGADAVAAAHLLSNGMDGAVTLAPGCTELMPQGDPPIMLVLHAAALSPRHAPPIRVLAQLEHRVQAEAKDSAWVAARKGIERTLADGGFEDALLCTPEIPRRVADGAGAEAPSESGRTTVLEGTQTNIFVVTTEGVVQTATEGVLLGTVRRVVLDTCARLGVPVSLEAPSLEGALAGQWRAAFLTSTSRLVLPIDEIFVPPSFRAPAASDTASDTVPSGGGVATESRRISSLDGVSVALSSATDPLVLALLSDVLQHVAERSTTVC